jgi:thiamine monophosphate synthase
MEAGAAGIAGIRIFWEMEDPAAQVAALRRSGELA